MHGNGHLFDSTPSEENPADGPASSPTCPKGSAAPGEGGASEEGGSDSGEGLSVAGTRVCILGLAYSRPYSASASAERGRLRREATSPDDGPKKSLLAHRKSLSRLVSEGVERKKGTASAECGTSMTSAKKAYGETPSLSGVSAATAAIGDGNPLTRTGGRALGSRIRSGLASLAPFVPSPPNRDRVTSAADLSSAVAGGRQAVEHLSRSIERTSARAPQIAAIAMSDALTPSAHRAPRGTLLIP